MRASQTNNRVRFKLMRILSVTFCFLFANTYVVYAQESNLTDIVYSKLAGDDVQINIVADTALDKPGAFSTDTPARIALDFFGMKSQLPSAQTMVESGKVKSVVAVETSDRTRVIINLYESARFKLNESENGYSVTVFKEESDVSVAVRPKPYAKKPDITPEISVSNIDFRRSEAGGGTLIVDLNDDEFAVDTRQRDGEIIVDLLGVSLPAELEQSLDVRDFATPVSKVDSFQSSDNVRLVVVPQGKFQHLSFQSGGRFTLIVDPIIETEEDVRNQEDLALGFQGERLSINFQNIDVRSALAVIADFTGINFVTSDSVRGELSLNLKDVPWDQALDVILRTKGLAQRQTGNVVWIAPSSEIQKYEEEELKAKQIVAEYAPLTTEVIQINYAKASDIAAVVKSVKVVAQGNIASDTQIPDSAAGAFNATETDKNSLLSPRGSVTVDERTNTLLVQDVAEYIADLREVISRLDKPVRQVLIETRIVEANDNFSRELGARLGFQRVTENAQFPGSNNSNIGTVVGSGTTDGVTTLSNSLNERNRAQQEADLNGEDIVPPSLVFDTGPAGLAVDLGANAIGGSQAASYAIDILKAGAGYTNLITLELSALEADGRGKIVASPRLVTANQKEARISQGQEVFVTVPGNGSGVGGGGGAGGGGGGGVERIDAVLELIVTPQITPDDRVIMDVRITQDQLIAASAAVTTLGTKEIETQILADNGETVVIGGIYQETESSGSTKVPFLGDVPVLGNLFKKKSRESRRTELLIFLTPKIISPKLNLG
ncbi:MAG: type IV pilus secretin PilQ [Gammaproteobacteria bacterium]|nr:type IV pilus secretin PilQ [Gammaproteobacteria bacterium]